MRRIPSEPVVPVALVTSVTEIGVIRSRFDCSEVGMRLGTVNLDRLHELRNDLCRICNSELREEEREFFVVSFRELRLDRVRQVPEAALERTERFLAGLVEELLVR